MAVADTMSYEELVLEVDFAGTGTWARICGITGVSVNRTVNVKTTEVPDCDDESQPHDVRRDPRSREVTLSGTGVWASTRHKDMMGWFYGTIGPKLSVRLRNTKVETEGASGDPYVETGLALLVTLSNERPDDKGVVTASIEIQFDGKPTLGAVA